MESFMNNGKKLSVGMLVLGLSTAAFSGAAPASAQEPDWNQRGDYYAPSGTTVQQPSAPQLRHDKEGDYYPPGRTIVQRPTSQELNQVRHGDYYPPEDSK